MHVIRCILVGLISVFVSLTGSISNAARPANNPIFEQKIRAHVKATFPEAVYVEFVSTKLTNSTAPEGAYLACFGEQQCILSVVRESNSGIVELGRSQRFSSVQRFPVLSAQGRTLVVSLFRNSLFSRWWSSSNIQYRNATFKVIGTDFFEEEFLQDGNATRVTQSFHRSTNLLTCKEISVYVKAGKRQEKHGRCNGIEPRTLDNFQL